MKFSKSIFVFILSFFISPSIFAHRIDIEKLLGPYPSQGSVEEALDYKQLLNYQNTRTEAQCKLASKDVNITLLGLYGGKHGIFNIFETFQLTPLFLLIQLKSLVYAKKAKAIFKRPRPYRANTNIKPCIKLESSSAYPSGHTMVARFSARVLGAMYPSRAKALLKRADEFSRNRVIGGVHHPSDIAAGKKLADTLAARFINSPYQLEFDL